MFDMFPVHIFGMNQISLYMFHRFHMNLNSLHMFDMIPHELGQCVQRLVTVPYVHEPEQPVHIPYVHHGPEQPGHVQYVQ